MNIALAYKMNRALTTGYRLLFGICGPGFTARYFSDIFPPVASGKRVIKDIGV